jgi:hypothetical protein
MLTYDFYEVINNLWSVACIGTFGKLYPLNYMEEGDEDGAIDVGHDFNEEVLMKCGEKCTLFVITYNYKEVAENVKGILN